MNYIYDITLNFNNELNNFYEWDEQDNIEFCLKIPIFRVEDDIIKEFIKSTFQVEKCFLQRIEDKTELYGKNNLENSKYSSIFVGNELVLAVSFNEKGISKEKSYLSIDEENEIIDYSKSIKYSLINYKVLSKNKTNYFITRNEKNNKVKLLNNIKNMYQSKEYEKLKYIFYEIYDEKSDNQNRIYSKLINLIENNSTKIDDMNKIINKIELSKKNIIV